MNEVPESLFLRLEHCQEVALIGHTPYSQTQLVNCTVQLLLQSSIFPMKEFEDWEREVSKTCMFHVLNDDDDSVDAESVSTANTLTHAVAHATVNSGVTAPTMPMLYTVFLPNFKVVRTCPYQK